MLSRVFTCSRPETAVLGLGNVVLSLENAILSLKNRYFYVFSARNSCSGHRKRYSEPQVHVFSRENTVSQGGWRVKYWRRWRRRSMRKRRRWMYIALVLMRWLSFKIFMECGTPVTQMLCLLLRNRRRLLRRVPHSVVAGVTRCSQLALFGHFIGVLVRRQVQHARMFW